MVEQAACQENPAEEVRIPPSDLRGPQPVGSFLQVSQSATSLARAGEGRPSSQGVERPAAVEPRGPGATSDRPPGRTGSLLPE